MSDRICKHCGQPESEHHEFAPVSMPAGCVCDPGTWGYDITPICDSFAGEAGQYCARCEHDEACHGARKGGAE